MKTFKEKLGEIYKEVFNHGQLNEYYPQVFIDKILALIESDIVGEEKDDVVENGYSETVVRGIVRQEQRSKLRK